MSAGACLGQNAERGAAVGVVCEGGIVVCLRLVAEQAERDLVARVEHCDIAERQLRTVGDPSHLLGVVRILLAHDGDPSFTLSARSLRIEAAGREAGEVGVDVLRDLHAQRATVGQAAFIGIAAEFEYGKIGHGGLRSSSRVSVYQFVRGACAM